MDQSLNRFFTPLVSGIKQYHTTILTIVIAIVIGVAVVRLYQVVIVSTDKGVEGYAPTQKADATFDQKTIDRVKNLKTASDTSDNLTFPKRPSPFVE
jgi:hypothetical protein